MWRWSFHSFKRASVQVGTGRRLPQFWHVMIFLLCVGMGLLWDQTPAQAADPVLSIATETRNVFNNPTFKVSVSLANSTLIGTAGFSLNIDQNCVTFDSITDSNGDGIPNSVTDLPNSILFGSTISYNASDVNSELDVTVRSLLAPVLGNLPSGTIATFEFGIKASCRTTDGTQKAVVFAFGNSPAVSFGSLLGLPVTGTATGGTVTLRFNAYPTNITASSTSVNENLAKGTTIGTLTSTDIDLSPAVPSFAEAHTYSLVSGTGSTDNSSFTLTGNSLKTNEIFDRETKNSYSIRLRTTDNYGGTYEKAFTITIADVNEAPTSISLSSSTVTENLASNTTVGSFTATDQDAGATATYALVSGTGDTGNGSFTLSGGTLRTNISFNYEISPTVNIRVRATDNGSLTFDSIFTINIANSNDAPIAADDMLTQTIVLAPVVLDVRANDTDADGNALSVAGVTSPISGTTSYSATAVTYTPSANYSGVITFDYTVSDSTLTDTGQVTLQVVANKARGDCNGDGNVNAGDFTAIILEEVDNDGTPNRWYNSYLGSFAGSPRGCDANASETINIADLSCTVLVFFGDTACTSGVVAASQALATPLATLGQRVADANHQSITVPLELQTNGNRIAAASFTLILDPQQLGLDQTDVNDDGVPDTVAVNLPEGMSSIVSYSTLTGRLNLTVFATRVPMPLLSDGQLANITLQIKEGAMTEIPILLTQGSLGNDQGQALPIELDSGLVRRIDLPHRLFLPSVLR